MVSRFRGTKSDWVRVQINNGKKFGDDWLGRWLGYLDFLSCWLGMWLGRKKALSDRYLSISPKAVILLRKVMVAGQNLNLRPSGYESGSLEFFSNR